MGDGQELKPIGDRALLQLCMDFVDLIVNDEAYQVSIPSTCFFSTRAFLRALRLDASYDVDPASLYRVNPVPRVMMLPYSGLTHDYIQQRCSLGPQWSHA